MLRAVYSERQLQEVLTDFWFNHFNVDARKGRDRFLLTEYERDVIRPRVLGKFRDLLGATAKSPAMLFYLDNWMSADPNGPHQTMTPGRGSCADRSAAACCMPPTARAPRRKARTRRKGLNENYGRELMELHTLGVDGGYTQKDVTEVARAFTGWTIENAAAGRRLQVRAAHSRHGQKVVLGHVIKAGGGESDGEQVLDILAKHPVDGALHRDQAGAPLRQRHAAAGARRSRGRALPRDRRRPARGDAHDPDVAGVPRRPTRIAPR